MLVQFQPHVLKIDMELIRNIDQDPVRQAIVCPRDVLKNSDL